MNKRIYINNVLASEEDIERLNYDIIYKNIHFTARKDWMGNQYVTTFC